MRYLYGLIISLSFVLLFSTNAYACENCDENEQIEEGIFSVEEYVESNQNDSLLEEKISIRSLPNCPIYGDDHHLSYVSIAFTEWKFTGEIVVYNGNLVRVLYRDERLNEMCTCGYYSGHYKIRTYYKYEAMIA